MFSFVMRGDARGTESQPLVVPNVEFDDGTRREVVYCCTMANDVYAFDASNGELLWVRNLGTPILDDQPQPNQLDWHHVNEHWGILSTPVIDTSTGTLYVVAWISLDGRYQSGQHYNCTRSP